MEEVELHDWNIQPSTPCSVRKQRSIEAYWLDRWYPAIADWTFETVFYQKMPERFPWPCAVRYESKSPKDSEHWGSVETAAEAELIFATSLRCARWPSGQGGRELICARRWESLGNEFRCFWNGQPTAISGESEPPPDLLDYLIKLAPCVPFYRCVLDIAERGHGYVLVEFNSWETNSGGQLFDWQTDHEILYGTNQITCRWPSGESQRAWPLESTLPRVIDQQIPLSECKPLPPCKPSNWILLSNGQLIVSTDVWLALIVQIEPLQVKYWRRGCFRFCHLESTENGFRAGDQYYWTDLTPSPAKPILPFPTADPIPEHGYKYGFAAKHGDRHVFCRFLEDRIVAIPI